MRIRKIILNNFGPFRKYEIEFPKEVDACVLLTGKNNEGKSTIINALKLLNNATKVMGKRKHLIQVDEDYYYELLKQDTEELIIGRLVYNYEENISTIIGIFDDDFEIQVFVNPLKNKIYADNINGIPKDMSSIFGFIPPLGPISEDEEIISNIFYLRFNTNTSLAPRHLRNHLYQLLTPEQFSLVRQIVNSSWEEIELEKYELNYLNNRIECYYKEKHITREISWAGQGLQVWFQIITHLVRLLESKLLVLDEPEINLHPEKQNDLIRILREYFRGGIIIATHSVELMNNVNISHIINVQKKQKTPKIKTSEDRLYLENVRESIGSNFNFIASQFEEVDILIFTEDTDDYVFLTAIANKIPINKKAFNIPIHGFAQYGIAPHYKNAYKLLIGKNIYSSIVLDRDYYPDSYLENIKKQLDGHKIKVIYTPGKEIENVFIKPELFRDLLDKEAYKNFYDYLNDYLELNKIAIQSDYIGMNIKYSNTKGIDPNTELKKLYPKFDSLWKNDSSKFEIVPGKKVIKEIRRYFQKNFEINLSNSKLINQLYSNKNKSIISFINSIYGLSKQGV